MDHSFSVFVGSEWNLTSNFTNNRYSLQACSLFVSQLFIPTWSFMFFIPKPITCYFPTDLLRWPSVDGDDGHRHHSKLPDTNHANNNHISQPRPKPPLLSLFTTVWGLHDRDLFEVSDFLFLFYPRKMRMYQFFNWVIGGLK